MQKISLLFSYFSVEPKPFQIWSTYLFLFMFDFIPKNVVLTNALEHMVQQCKRLLPDFCGFLRGVECAHTRGDFSQATCRSLFHIP